MKKVERKPSFTVTIKGMRLFDPRIGKFRKPGNQNPGLILYDLAKRGGFEITDDFTTMIKEMADYCDGKKMKMNLVRGIIDCLKGGK